MDYKSKKLRDRNTEWESCGGIEGMYRYLRAKRQTRYQIAETFGMSVSALASWITKWNKVRKSVTTDKE